jgi:hypothetical protein
MTYTNAVDEFKETSRYICLQVRSLLQNHSQRPCSKPSRGSGINNGLHETTILGTSAETAKQESHKELLWLQKFHTSTFQHPPVGPLPTDRTVGSVPFEVLGIDYASPITYRSSKKIIGKAYILLFACSLTLAI